MCRGRPRPDGQGWAGVLSTCCIHSERGDYAPPTPQPHKVHTRVELLLAASADTHLSRPSACSAGGPSRSASGSTKLWCDLSALSTWAAQEVGIMSPAYAFNQSPVLLWHVVQSNCVREPRPPSKCFAVPTIPHRKKHARASDPAHAPLTHNPPPSPPHTHTNTCALAGAHGHACK